MDFQTNVSSEAVNKELEIWQFAARKLNRNESVMLLVVAESSGSSPGRQGFKMVVARDEIMGSIGGGVMEINLVEQAKLKLQNEQSKFDSEIVEQIHRKSSPDSSGMICSGKQTVIFSKLDPSQLKVIDKIIEVLENKHYQFLRIKPDNFEVIDLLRAKESEGGIQKNPVKVLTSYLKGKAKTIFYMMS